MPALESTAIPEVLKRPEVLGVFVGGCVSRGEHSSFRAQAHAHTNGDHAGWICIRAAWRLTEHDLLRHELAHILSGEGHTAKFRAVLTELSGGVLPKTDRMVPRQASHHCRGKYYHGLCDGKAIKRASYYDNTPGRAERLIPTRYCRCLCWCHTRSSEPSVVSGEKEKR